MKTLIAAAIRCFLLFAVPSVTYAISAQWDLDPISGDWNTAANWTPDGVPNGPADIATFGLSNTTDVSISANTEVNSIIFTPAATNPYTITANPGLTLTLSGAGVINNSGTTQHFFVSGDRLGNPGTVVFSNSATAGSNVRAYNHGGIIEFLNHSSAGSLDVFNDDFGEMTFLDNSTAGDANIDTFTAFIHFANNSTAGSAQIHVTDDSFLQFVDTSSANNAFIISEGSVTFSDSATAGNATIINVAFLSFSGDSMGGTAQIELPFNPATKAIGLLDISEHNAPGVTIGSLAGDEGANVFLGANNLTIGSNNLSTTFSGVIRDGLVGTGGSLTKIGSGTLILSGANTYTGDTNVNRGVLQVDGSITSNTFVNNRGTLAGTGTIFGNVVNNSRVSPGSIGAPGTLTITGNYTQAQFATLMLQIAGTSAGEFSVLNVLGNANLNGFLDPVLLNGFAPTLGDSFIFLNYASLTGEFSHIKHRFFGNGLQWSVIYEANHAILTVEQHVPDQGSTLLLLGLGLLGLVTFRRQLLRTQP
jgi:autotransporter-associated beta strand protein